MSRIAIPESIEAAPAASHELLAAVKRQLGTVPNLFRMVANSPAALGAYLGIMGALAKGSLPRATHERIALVVAEQNGCSYCLSAHTYLGKHVAKLDEAEIALNRRGASGDPKADAAVKFALEIVRARGHVGDAAVASVKAAGYTDAEIVEIVMHVALNTWTNYVNEVARTEVDFPVIVPSRAA